MNKYLGVDYGTKKIGISVSDDDGIVAFPHSIVIAAPDAHAQIKDIARENGIKEIVIGHSKDMDGTENPLMKYIYAFKKELEDDEYIVHLEEEFFTTFQAKRMSDDSVADASAAAIILQSFLDKQGN